MPRKFFLLPALLLPSLAYAQTPPNPAAANIAGLLANDARDLLRDPNLAPEVAADQATILLQFSSRLDPDLHNLRLLAETARLSGNADLHRNTLRAIISADPGDLLSQVHYIDLLAAESQTLDARAALYQNALNQNSFDAQIRSEMALRLARLAEDRGDSDQAQSFLTQAIKLNDLNIAALRDATRLAAADTSPSAPTRHLQAISALLVANPYQPDAWMQVAHLCQTAGVHDRAQEFLTTAAEQLQIDSASPGGDLYLELALEQAIAGQRASALSLANGLSQLPDAPLSALLIAQLLAQDSPPPPAQPTTATKPAFDLPVEIHKRLVDLAKDTANAAALADAAAADLSIMAKPSPETTAWIEAYAKLVDPADVTLTRLNGWLLYRNNQFTQAAAALEKIADTDPMAQLGLARIALEQNKPDQARALLQKIWNTNPTGLLALQVSVAAAKGKLELADSPAARQMRAAITRLTPGLSAMHRQPRDVLLISANYRKDSVPFGDPVILQIRISNTSDRALPVGPDGMVKTSLGIAAFSRGTTAQPLGLCAVEDVQRTFRLEPRQVIETSIRVDQGKLADLLQRNPGSAYAVSVNLVTAPRILSADQYTSGVGGLAVAIGDFQRGRFPVAAEGDLQRLAQELTTLTADKQLVRIQAAGALVAADSAKARPDLITALQSLTAAKDPLIKAAILRALPPDPITAPFDNALNALAADPDPLVRLLWCSRQARIAAFHADLASAALAALQKQSTTENDPLVKKWLEILLTQFATATAPK